MKSIFLFSIIAISILGCQHDSTEEAPLVNTSTPEIVPIVSVTITPPVPIPPCPADMVFVTKSNFCIDKYEWPNKAGEYPDFAMTAYQAEHFCRSIGKRLCTHTEWVGACTGQANLSYGYGTHWQKNTCNDSADHYIGVDWSRMNDPIAWKIYAKTLYKGTPSGSKPGCCVDEGSDQVFDMIGNVREWVKDPLGNGGYAFESSFWYATMVGPAGCGFVIRNHSPGFASYEVGTRCCKASN